MNELLEKMTEAQDKKSSRDEFADMTEEQKLGATTAAVIGHCGHIKDLINGRDTLDKEAIKELDDITDELFSAMLDCAVYFDVDLEKVKDTIRMADIIMGFLK